MRIAFNKVRFTIDATNQCVGRDCSMCSGNPKPVRTQSFTPEQARWIVQETAKYKLGLEIALTGGGETLLAPDLSTIVNEFLYYPRTSSVSIVTSGFLPEERIEKKNVEEILKLKNAYKVDFNLSFHAFGKGFYHRFKNTLRYLMQQPQIDRVKVKMTYGDKTIAKTLIQFQEILCALALEESPFSTVNEFGIDASSENVQRLLNSPVIKKLVLEYSEENALKIMAGILTVPFKYIFRREHLSKKPFEVWLQPQEVSLFGKGSSIDIKRRTQPFQCATIFGHSPLFENNTANLHIGSDGNYYPSCGCPYDKAICLGSVGNDPLFKVLGRLAKFQLDTVEKLCLKRFEFYEKIPCSECIKLTSSNH